MSSTPIAAAVGLPLWSLSLVQYRGKQQVIALAHHTIMDGESVTMFLQEVIENVDLLHGRDAQEQGELLEEVLPMPFCESQDSLVGRLEVGTGIGSRLAHIGRQVAW